MGGTSAARFSGISPPSQTPLLGGVWAEAAGASFASLFQLLRDDFLSLCCARFYNCLIEHKHIHALTL